VQVSSLGRRNYGKIPWLRVSKIGSSKCCQWNPPPWPLVLERALNAHHLRLISMVTTVCQRCPRIELAFHCARPAYVDRRRRVLPKRGRGKINLSCILIIIYFSGSYLRKWLTVRFEVPYVVRVSEITILEVIWRGFRYMCRFSSTHESHAVTVN
jgi:hypothetical protein